MLPIQQPNNMFQFVRQAIRSLNAAQINHINRFAPGVACFLRYEIAYSRKSAQNANEIVRLYIPFAQTAANAIAHVWRVETPSFFVISSIHAHPARFRVEYHCQDAQIVDFFTSCVFVPPSHALVLMTSFAQFLIIHHVDHHNSSRYNSLGMIEKTNPLKKQSVT